MKESRGLVKRLRNLIFASGQSLPGIPIVELAGNKRVLIENHLGITEYEHEKIGVLVKYGKVTITGESLEIGRLSNQQLVITGRIDGIQMERGEPQ